METHLLFLNYLNIITIILPGALPLTLLEHLRLVTVTDTNMPTETQYAMRWYARDDTSKAAKNQTDEKTNSGQTDFATGTSPIIYRNANADEFYIQVLCKIKGDTRGMF